MFKKILSIVGARPQFIKAAVVSRALRGRQFHEILVHTGQHYDFNMSDVFFEELGLPAPDHYLQVGSGRHGEQTGKMLMKIEEVLLHEQPDLVLVYGDTNSTLAGALAAVKLHIPLAHVEAGLRSYNKLMPEEVNRVLTDDISDILFCPTRLAVRNLEKEGFTNITNEGELVDDEKAPFSDHNGQPCVVNVGDVMFDLAREISSIHGQAKILDTYGLTAKGFILVTIHRAENTDDEHNLRSIWDALMAIARSGITIIFPMHPRTRAVVEALGLMDDLPQSFLVTTPVSYTDMIVLEERAKVIITDSGGVQKEGYFFKTPCVIPRGETEWVELVEAGWNILTGPICERIIEATFSFYQEGLATEWQSYYGNGNASRTIAGLIERYGEGR
ncbi:MAG: UDP-2,3-diacetamido-2,3-dideoxy-D-glucuronate 2-epimerase [Syntrophorhabdus sp. PtaU1.Bin002]|nr:MAG: UDP-2,3-diacetamido-2,3-dideoxy-D-glucuronate 2-epimerase [Syntrophorhabdus sp. PtaU1.Bin002]